MGQEKRGIRSALGLNVSTNNLGIETEEEYLDTEPSANEAIATSTNTVYFLTRPRSPTGGVAEIAMTKEK